MSRLSNYGGRKHFNDKKAQTWRLFGDDDDSPRNIHVETPIKAQIDAMNAADDGAVGKARSMKPTPRGFNILYHDNGPKPRPEAAPVESVADNQPVNPKLLSMKPTPRNYNILYHDGGPQNPSDQPNRSSAPTSVEANQQLTGKQQSMKPAARDYNILFHVQTAPIDNSNLPADRMSPTNQDASIHNQSGDGDMIEEDDTQSSHQMADHSLISSPEPEPPFAENSTSRAEFRDPRSINDELTSRQSPRKTGKQCGYNQGPASMGIVPVTNISNRRNSAEGRKVLEKISYEHNMDSRQDPQHSERGKRQGAFVWEDVSNAQNINSSRPTSSQAR